MTITELSKEIKARKFKPVYLLHGEEPYFIDQITDLLEQTVLTDAEKGFNLTVLYGKDTDMSTILNASKRYPMMSEYQLVIVKEAQDLKWGKEEENEHVLAYFEKPFASTILVLAYKYGNYDKRKKLYKHIDKSGQTFLSEPIKEYKLAPWIEELIKSKGAQIAPQAALLMAEYLGSDLSKIANETDKMLLNIAKGTIINSDHIQENIGISKDYNVFELQNALAKKDPLKSNQIIQYFADNPKSNPMVVVLANLNAYFTKLLKYHALPNKGNAAKELGVNPYFLKDYDIAARNYPPQKVIQIISYLRECDIKSKGVDSTGNVADGLLLKELVFKILH